MKPYTLLTEYQSSNDLTYGLYERDGNKYYQINSQPVASSKESNCETDLAFTLSRPFKPAKQPKVLIVGLGAGCFLNAISESMTQKKACFELIDPNPKAFEWFKEHLAQDEASVERTEFSPELVKSYVKSKAEKYNAIFVDPEYWRSTEQGEDLLSKIYINYFVNALKRGGLMGMVTERPDKIVQGRLERSGFEVNVERIAAVPGGKRQRTIWVAKKGHYVRQGAE